MSGEYIHAESLDLWLEVLGAAVGGVARNQGSNTTLIILIH
jgi:hypothetical protein